MATRLPPLGAFRVFEAAARHLSFTRAAAELGTTQAAVSWQIKSLEQHLGLALFERLPRRLLLTEAGLALQPGVSGAFRQLAGAVDAVAQRPASAGILSISAVPTFTNNWLVPRLGGFQLAHPDLAVRLDNATDLVDFTAGSDFDVAIRSGRGGWDGLVAHRLLPVLSTPLCTPALAAKLGANPRPRDLLKLPLLQPYETWVRWLALAGEKNLARSKPVVAATYPRQHMAGRAAIAGQGVALLNPAFFPIPLGDGRLVQPFEQVLQVDEEWYWLVYPKGRAATRKIAVFRDWLLAEIGGEAMKPRRRTKPISRAPGSKRR